MIKWIGIEAESLDGDVKKFIWADNVRRLNLRNPEQRSALARYMTNSKLRGIEITIGPAIDLEESSQDADRVGIIMKPGYYGIYVEETKRPGYNFFMKVGGPADSVSAAQNRFGQRYQDIFSQVSLSLKKLIP